MRNTTFPTRKIFKSLLLAHTDASGYDIELKNDAEKVAFLVDTIKAECGWMLEKQSVFAMSLHWLQGLASACTIPFYNADIVNWLESQGYKITPHNECEAIEKYWANAAFALAAMVNKGV